MLYYVILYYFILYYIILQPLSVNNGFAVQSAFTPAVSQEEKTREKNEREQKGGERGQR